jgi:tRNA nucleotidyltransferase (CCA-adding enzyme)
LDRGPAVLDPAAPPSVVTGNLERVPTEALVLLRAGVGEPGSAVLERYVRDWRRVRLAITGEDLKRLGYPEGRALGLALRETQRARLDGEVEGREAELEYARRVLEHGERR